MARNNVIRMNTLHLNSVRLNGIGEVQSVSLSAGADPEQPPVEPSNYIQFEDPAVEAICVANWSSDGIGLTMEDAAAVTSLGTVFYNNKDIVSFDELQYFTGLTKLYCNSSLGVFYNCSNLKSVKIPASVTEIGLRTFANCNALTDVGSLENVEIIGDIAFVNTNALAIVLNTPKLREIQGKNNFTYSGITGIESLGSVTKIPDGTAYNNGVFAYCAALAYANLNESTTYIGAHSFRGCTSLSQINIPSGVTTIGADAFNGDTSLFFDELNLANLTTLGQNAFYGVKIKKLNLGKVTALPTGASGTSQYYGDKNTLEEVIIPEGVTEIPALSFANYKNLTKCDLPNSVTFIGGSAMHSTAITEQYLPNVETIDKNAFQNCTKLLLVDIGDKCTAINQQAFKVCAALESLVVRATTPPTAGAEILISTTCPIYVPDASLEAYKTATNWSTYADRIYPLSEIEGSLVLYDKLVGDGTAYINTEYYPKGSDSFVFETGAVSTLNKFLFGVKSASICLGMLPYATRKTYVLSGASTATEFSADWSVRSIKALRCENEGGAYVRKYYNITAGGNTNIANVDSYVNVVAEQPLLLFACQSSPSSSSLDSRIFCDAIYGFSIEDIDGNTIMSLKPCTWNGEAGMWDEVGNKFYGNAAASGEFSVANDE